MNIRKAFFSIFSSVLMLGVMLPVAKADEGNQQTELTFSQPVQIPGQILPAGTYQFVIIDDTASLNTVQIFSADRQKLYATLVTVPAIRPEPADGTVLSFAERGSGQPEALQSWFYPGMLDGHEFIYGKQEERELSGDSKFTVTATPVDTGNRGVVSGN
jgi:hypothetical protein